MESRSEAYGAPSDGVGGFLTLAVNGFDALAAPGLSEAPAGLGFSYGHHIEWDAPAGRKIGHENRQPHAGSAPRPSEAAAESAVPTENWQEWRRPDR